MAIAAPFFMPRSLNPTQAANKFQSVSKNVKILQIGSIEPKLWKIREINLVKFDWYNIKSIPYFSFMKCQELV